MRHEPESEKIIDGKRISREIISNLKVEVESFSDVFRPPCLKVILLGEDPASRVYVRSKIKTSAKCGIESELIELSEETGEDELLELVENLNGDPSIDGILVQLPLPPPYRSRKGDREDIPLQGRGRFPSLQSGQDTGG